MFSPDDTIVAVATAAGRAGIGVVRIMGLFGPQSGLPAPHAGLGRIS